MTNDRYLPVAAGTLLILAAAHCGCARLPKFWREAPDLPSPQATIAAAEEQDLAASLPAKRSESATSRADRAAADRTLSRGRTLEKAGQWDAAYKLYETALAERPGNAALLHRLGIIADRQKKHVEAEQYFLQALQAEPQNAEFLGDLGYCCYLQGKLDQAATTLHQAVDLDPQQPRHRNNLGLVLGLKRDYDGAFAQFSAAAGEADAYYNMAFVFAAQDLPEEAIACFQEALAADPSHRRSQEALVSFQQYEQTPLPLRDRESAVAEGVRYVPYIETMESAGADGEVQQASATASIPASRHAGRATRTLQLESRGLLNRHLQSQRGE